MRAAGYVLSVRLIRHARPDRAADALRARVGRVLESRRPEDKQMPEKLAREEARLLAADSGLAVSGKATTTDLTLLRRGQPEPGRAPV